MVPYQGGGGQAPALPEFAATGQNCRRSQTSPRYRNSPVRRCQDARHDAICSGSTGLKPVLLAHRALPLASLTARAPYERLPSGSYTQFPILLAFMTLCSVHSRQHLIRLQLFHALHRAVATGCRLPGFRAVARTAEDVMALHGVWLSERPVAHRTCGAVQDRRRACPTPRPGAKARYRSRP